MLRALIVTSALLAFLAPGSAGADELTPDRAREVVRATTLAAADLPGWIAVDADESEPSAEDPVLVRCLGLTADPGSVVRAASPVFVQRRTGTMVGSQATATATSADAARIAALVGSARARRCFAKAIRQVMAAEHVRRASVAIRPLWVPGAAAGGMRIRMRFGHSTFVEDLRAIAVGPVVVAMTVIHGVRRLPEAQARGLLAALRSRGEAALATGPSMDPPAEAPAG